MGKIDSLPKLAIVGNTRLTLDGMKAILRLLTHEISYVFGLKDENLAGKVNSVSLDDFCSDNQIVLDKSENWNNCFQFCHENDIELIVTLGDSRIVPKNIIDSFKVIGNHGAILPYVQGGASLVWGRVLNSGTWGVSIMRIGERVDGGDILKTEIFTYDNNTTEEEFTTRADDLTVELLIEVLNGNYSVRKNTKWNIKISKHTDSCKTIEMLRYCLANDLCIYLPPRTPADGIIKKEWAAEFIKSFKIANDKPYPKWSE